MGLLNEVEIRYRNKYKDYYKNINKHFVKNKGKDIHFNWDDRCYIPIAGTIAELSNGSSDMSVILSIINDAGIVASLCGWKANNKRIVKVSEFEKERYLHQNYTEYPININKIFEKINYGTYLEFSIDNLDIFDINMDGALLSIEYDVNEQRLELRIYIVCKDKSLRPFVLHLDENKSLLECIDETLSYTSSKVKEHLKNNKVADITNLQLVKELDDKSSLYLLNYIIFCNLLQLINIL